MAAAKDTDRPDGSAYREHMQRVAARNNEAKKVAKAERTERERLQAVASRAEEVRLHENLMRSSRTRGKDEIPAK